VPTLAATVALHGHTAYPGVVEAIHASVAFLIRSAAQWDCAFRTDWPVGVEMTLPSLLDLALAAGIALPPTLYTTLRERRQVWIQKLTRYPVTAGAPVLYCFEAWGTVADPSLLDAEGSVGNSPAATAHWLALARSRPDLEADCLRAENYLRSASSALAVAQPGIYPTLWPLIHFERSFLLHTLQMVGLLRHPCLEDSVAVQGQALFAAMRSDGIGYSDSFLSDGDDTGAAACALLTLGYPVDPCTLSRYAVGDHFVTYPGELDPSLSTTARMAQARRLQQGPLPQTSRFFREQQRPDGRWVMDKWHASWLYATFLILAYLAPAGETESVLAAGEAICRFQNRDGAWEADGTASRMETAFALLALTVLCRHGYATEAIRQAHHRGLGWLRHAQHARTHPSRLDWIAKTAYTVPNVDRCFELCALLVNPCPFPIPPKALSETRQPRDTLKTDLL
jgi:hypothetical protein